MDIALENLPKGVVPASVILELVYEGRYFANPTEDEELLLSLASELHIDDESLEKLVEANPPFGSGKF